jgi:Flp pilus assembly pilin Flp
MRNLNAQRASGRRLDGGAALIEYCLLAALIAVIGIGAIQKVGEGIKHKATEVKLAVASGAIDCDPDVDPDC